MGRLLELTAALYQRFFMRPFQGESDKLEAIVEIVAENNPALVPSLSCFLTDASPLVKRAAADAVGRLVALCRPEQLVALDESMRSHFGWHPYREWDRIRKQDVDRLPASKSMQSATLGLASCHHNGHVRERAVQLLDAINDGSELPFLLIRLNDWVAPVRQAARTAVERRLHGGVLEPFVANVPHVFRLLEQQRVDHTALVCAVMRVLIQPENEAVLVGMVNSDNRFVRRTAFREAMELPGNHRFRLLDVCIRSPDTVIRLWSARRGVALLDQDSLTEVLQHLERDTFMPVRREVLRVRIECFPGEAEGSLGTALLDRSFAIRDEARFHLRKRGEVEFAETYRHAFRKGIVCEAAVAGLGETGVAEDVDLILPFLQSDSARMRAVGVAAVGHLDGETHVEAIFERLKDVSPRVAKEAAKALGECTSSIGQERLWELFCSEKREHVRLAVLRFLDGLPAWEKLPYMIRAAADQNERIASRAVVSVTQLYNRVYTKPSGEQEARLQASIAETAGRLPPTFGEELQMWLSR